MEITNILKIYCEPLQIEKITQILDKYQSKEDLEYWNWILTEKDSDPSVDFINEFLNLLENKYDKLMELGIKRDDITIWTYYEYDEQCNMEFEPKDMKRLGEHGITLCVSCWQSSEESSLS